MPSLYPQNLQPLAEHKARTETDKRGAQVWALHPKEGFREAAPATPGVAETSSPDRLCPTPEVPMGALGTCLPASSTTGPQPSLASPCLTLCPHLRPAFLQGGRPREGSIPSSHSQEPTLSPRWLLIPTPTPSIRSTETRDTTPSKKSSRHGFIQQSLYPVPLWATLCSENLPSPPLPHVSPRAPPWTPPYLGPIPQCQNSSFLICVPCPVTKPKPQPRAWCREILGD